MALFSYKATTLTGEIVEGVIEATEEKGALDKLKSTGVIPLWVRPPKQALMRRFSLRRPKGDLLTFTSEVSALLGAGLPLDRSLTILSEISEAKEMKEVVQGVLKSIREGSSFSEALEKRPKLFNPLYVSMVRAGEAGGVLDVVLEKLTEFQETSKELKDHVFSAMIYPVILLITGGLSMVLLITFVLPRFSTIFAELGSALPLPTQILIAFSTGLRAYWWILPLAAIIGWALFKSATRSEEGKYKWDRFKLRLLGDIITKLETARFCRTLGTLLRSGVPLLQALTNSKGVITNRVIAAAIDDVSKGAKEGRGIAVPLSETHVLPSLALSMVKVGEETGQLDTMLLKVATTYERSLREAIKRFVGFFEPVMILFMGLVIGFIVVSMLLAIFSIAELPF
jgi:general secretion pathway protein F